MLDLFTDYTPVWYAESNDVSLDVGYWLNKDTEDLF